MGNTKRMQPGRQTKQLQLVGLASLALVTGGLVVAALADTPAASTASPVPASTVSETPSAPATVAPATLDSADLTAAMTRLNDSSLTWTLTVLGDSTGNDGDEWVAELGRTIAADKERPVTYYAWDATTSSYAAPVTYGRGNGAPVTVYNGSASGMGPDYSLANLAALAPQASDVLIVNHGHNFVSAQQGVADEASLVTAIADQWQSTPAVAVVLQNPRTTNGEAQEANISAVAESFAGSTYTVIDVAAAYRGQPDLAALLQADGTHPNAVGQALWSQTMKASLGL